MEIWDNNFYGLRNNHIVPLVAYQGDYSKSEFSNLKTLLSSKFVSVTNPTAKTFELEFEPEIFYKALINDIEFFFTRAIVQAVDLSISNTQSNAWRFVTQYYFNFFSVTALFRILKRGFVFFSRNECDSFNVLATFLLRSRVQVDTGNYYFSYKRTENNGNFVVDFKNVGEGVHNKTWHEASYLLNTFYQDSDNDEKIIIGMLRKMCQDYKPDFPSDVRNSINYHGQYGMKSILQEFDFFDVASDKDRYIKSVINYKKSEGISHIAKDVGLFGYYFFLMAKDLLADYYERHHIKSDFRKKRDAYLKKHNITFDN